MDECFHRIKTRVKKSLVLNGILTLLIMTSFDGVLPCEDIEIDYLIDYVEKNLSMYKVNVMVESFDQLSPFAIKITRRINERIPSHNGLARTLSSYEKQQVYENLLETTFSVHDVKQVPERVSLTIGILESLNKSHVMPRMVNMLQNFVALNPLTRGKYLIHLFTEVDIDLLQFFQKAWSWKFLDLTVIQWVQQKHIGTVGIKAMPCTAEYEGLFYTYDPFNGAFTKEVATEQTKLFPDKLKNLRGFPLMIHQMGRKISEIKGNDSWDSLIDLSGMNLMRILFETLNCTIKITALGETPGSPKCLIHLPVEGSPIRRIRAWSGDHDFSLPVLFRRQVSAEEHQWEWYFYFYLSQIRVPSPISYNLHLLRLKTYERQISSVAIIAFAGLFFTAFIFAVWAQFLGFKERNWSFLNILTAQMGGSIEHRGRMKLSEKIFQMSIYIATFIVVTLGVDYMLEIFVEHQELSEIKTIQDLANSDMDFVVKDVQKGVLMTLPKDPTLLKIYNRTSWRHREQGSHSFCELPSTDLSVFDERINLCVTKSRDLQHVLESSHRYQIDKIQDPVAIAFPILSIGQSFSPLRFRSEELIYKFLQLGLVDKSQRDELHRQNLKEEFGRTTITEKDEDQGIPMQNQLWPILVIGWGMFALIAEFIWKRYIERTELGKAVKAFYSDSRPGSTLREPRKPVHAILDRLNSEEEQNSRM